MLKLVQVAPECGLFKKEVLLNLMMCSIRNASSLPHGMWMFKVTHQPIEFRSRGLPFVLIPKNDTN